MAALREAHQRLVNAGVSVEGMADHTISQSLYLRDPDGNEIEVYVDDPTIDWRNDADWTRQPVRQLDLNRP